MNNESSVNESTVATNNETVTNTVAPSGARIKGGEQSRDFILAGNAHVTLVSQKTGARFTYRVEQPSADKPHFVALLTGEDNQSNYEFVGTIFRGADYYHGSKSRITPDAPGAKAFAYAWKHLSQGKMPPDCEVWHSGRCGRCGRLLTVPESIETGLGPVCAEKS